MELLDRLSEILESDNCEGDKLLMILKVVGENKDDDLKETKLDLALFERWIGRQNLASNSVLSYRGKFRQFLNYAQSRNICLVKNVTTEVSGDYVAKIYHEKHSAGYDVIVLRKIWKDMFPRSSNPWCVNVHPVPIPTKGNMSHRTISGEEMKKVERRINEEIARRKEGLVKTHNHLGPDTYEELKDAIKFAKYYGMRISSFSNMKMIDFRRYKTRKMFLHIPEKTKSVKTRPLELPVVGEISEILDRRYKKNSNEYLFPLLHKRYLKGTSSISVLFRRIKTKERIRDNASGIVSLHSYRASFITRMDEVNAPASITDNITGHAPQDMHNLYSKPRISVKRKWIEKALKVNSMPR